MHTGVSRDQKRLGTVLHFDWNKLQATFDCKIVSVSRQHPLSSKRFVVLRASSGVIHHFQHTLIVAAAVSARAISDTGETKLSDPDGK